MTDQELEQEYERRISELHDDDLNADAMAVVLLLAFVCIAAAMLLS